MATTRQLQWTSRLDTANFGGRKRAALCSDDYRVTDAKGRYVKYRERWVTRADTIERPPVDDFTREALDLIDGTAGEEVSLEGWLKRAMLPLSPLSPIRVRQ